MDVLERQVAFQRRRRATVGVAAVVLAGGAGAAYAWQQARLQQQRQRQERKTASSDAPQGQLVPAGKRKAGGRRPPRGPAAVQQMIRYLLPLVGRRVCVMVALAIARTLLSNRLARVQGFMFRSAFLKRVPLFARNLAENVALCVAAAAVDATSRRVLETVTLDWRRHLTDRIHRLYFDNMTYYKLSYVDRRVANPEQRVCEDVPLLADGLGDLLREWCNASVDALFYAFMLRRYSRTNRYTGAIVGYVLGAGALTTLLSPNFGRLYRRQSENEGEYRQLQTRLRANAEPVAFYGGIAKEGGLIDAAFRRLTRHRGQLLRTQWLFGMWQDFNTKYLAATVAVALIIGPFFTGHLRPDDSLRGRARLLSGMRYHTSVIICLFQALGTLAASSRKLLKLAAYAERIQELQAAVRDVHAGTGAEAGSVGARAAGRVESAKDEIAFEGARVVTPGDATLVEDLTLRVRAGTNLLVTGPNGSGKSSLFRVLGGLWPLTAGVVRKPGGAGGGLAHEIFYVPQRPYVTVGTLQDQLIYPLTRAELAPGRRVDGARLRRLLAEVDLEYLVEREGGPDAVVDWGAQLSLGEQQRLGMARLFWHKPKFAILDECTSGVTVDMEERFCERVKRMGCTCVTISHRPALVAFHDLVLALDGEGGWRLRSGQAGGSTGGVEASSNARGADAAECLSGMQAAAKEPGSSVGRVLARAPEAAPAGGQPAPAAAERALSPAEQLQAREAPLGQRWRQILRLVLGRGTGAPHQIGAIMVVVVLRTLLQDRVAALNGRSVRHVLNQDLRAFVRLIALSAFQSAASAVLAPSLKLVADRLALEWRRTLTRAAHAKYLRGTTFYSVSQLAGMQDVDARLTRDVERLADGMSQLIPSMVKPVVDIAWFTVQLARLTGARGMAILYAYALGGLLILRLVTPDFGGLANQEYRLEAAFRNLHARLRTHAESVAFFGGGAREGAVVTGAFRDLTRHLRRVIDVRWLHAVADDFLAKQLPHNVTWGLTMLYSLEHPSNFEDTATQGDLVNDMRYLASVVTTCFSSFGELLALHKRFAELSGGIARVSEMLETIDAAHALPQQYRRPAQVAGAEAIEFDQVDVRSPTGACLARALSLRLAAGRSLLVTGPNGCGKSSVVRALGGLWPLAAGAVTRPQDAANSGRRAVFYIPQKPYTTPGTLREQVIYPLTPEEAAAREAGGGTAERAAALDARLEGLMCVVRLTYLVQRQGGWGAQAEWGDVLSLGEQQRLGMARLFFHRPAFGVLDECTNATSVDVEEALYAHAASLGITLLTVTQRAALLKHHAAELRLTDGAGGWELREIRHGAAPGGGAPANGHGAE